MLKVWLLNLKSTKTDRSLKGVVVLGFQPGAAGENRAAAAGWAMILAKKGLSNFIGHFKPLACPMALRMDFGHANSPWRIHLFVHIFAAEPNVELLTF